MDTIDQKNTIAKYIQSIKEVITDYNKFKVSNIDLSHKMIMDDEHLHYQFARVGYQGKRHIFMTVFHIDIIGDKVWIQEDRTERGVAYRLMEKGIPQSNIVLGYFDPSFRENVEGFAMG